LIGNPAKEGLTMQERLPAFICARYREIAENRQYRLSGYAEPKACVATDQQITAIELSVGNGQIDWRKDAQGRVVNEVVDRLIAQMG
jgi:hypothetical protein